MSKRWSRAYTRNTEEGSYEPEILLWAAVIRQAWVDANMNMEWDCRSKWTRYRSGAREGTRQEAREWFESPEYMELCELLGLEPDFLLRELERKRDGG